MLKSEKSIVAIIWRALYEILAHCINFLGNPGKEPEFVGFWHHATLTAGRDDIQISRNTC